MYVNELLELLKDSKYGLRIESFNISCPAYADDVTPGSIHKHGLNEMLKIAYDYSQKWLYEYNPKKCSYIVWGNDKSPELSVKLGQHNLSRVTTCKHMGVQLIENKHVDENTLSTRIGAGRKPLLSFRGVGTHFVHAVPTVMNTTYNRLSLSRMLYGIKIIPKSNSSMCVRTRSFETR